MVKSKSPSMFGTSIADTNGVQGVKTDIFLSLIAGVVRGSRPRTFENRGGRPPKQLDILVFIFLKRIFFTFSNIFKIKWSKSEVKLNFGDCLVWVPMDLIPTIKISWRRPYMYLRCGVLAFEAGTSG